MKQMLLVALVIALIATACGTTAESREMQGYARLLGNTGCSFDIGSMRGSWDVGIAITGPARNSAKVDIALPGRNSSLPVRAQYNKKFFGTDEPFIYQTYNYDVTWMRGEYRLSVVNGGRSASQSFTLDNEADWLVYVHCK